MQRAKAGWQKYGPGGPRAEPWPAPFLDKFEFVGDIAVQKLIWSLTVDSPVLLALTPFLMSFSRRGQLN